MMVTPSAASSTQPSDFDVLFDSYWQDYQLKLPIAGGMAFQDELYTCQLDGSLDSLKRIDRLLLTLKKQLHEREEQLLARADFRHFMLFVASYAAQVLSQQTGRQLSWQTFDRHSANHFAQFYITMAAVDIHDHQMPPFFGLLVLAARLFGRFDYKFTHPITAELIPESLYWSVMAYLSDDIKNKTADDEMAVATLTPPSAAIQKAHPSVEPIIKPSAYAQVPDSSTAMPKTATQNPIHSSTDTKSHSNIVSTKTAEPINQAAQTIVLKQEASQTQTKSHGYLDELKLDLVHLAAAQHPHQAHYDKAMTVIHAFTEKQKTADIKLLEPKYQQALQQALQLLIKLANAGNTNAMLSLAVLYFEGKWLKMDATKGAALTQKAADIGDVRAQKLLSRLYYQGVGVSLSAQMGELWLNKAADNGHPEAKKIQNQFNQIRLMQDDFRIESQKDQRYLAGAVLVGMFFIMMIWLSAKFLA